MPKNNTGQNIAKSTEATPVDDFTVISRKKNIGTYLDVTKSLLSITKVYEEEGRQKMALKNYYYCLVDKVNGFFQK